MGVHATEEEADAAVCYYDLDGTGEMSYEVRVAWGVAVLVFVVVGCGGGGSGGGGGWR